MAVDPKHYNYHPRRRQLKDFERKAKELLTDSDRKYLYNVLKDYQMHRQVELLISSLQVALDTPTKMDLFLNIRHFLPAAHLARYDRLVPYHKMASAAQVDSLDGLFQGPGPPGSVVDSGGDASSVMYGSLSRLHAGRHMGSMREASMNGTMSLGRRPRGTGLSVSRASSPRLVRQTQAGRTVVTGSAELEERGPIKTLLLVREADDNLGFSVRGGSEHGLGIYVSEIMEGSAGDLAGLHPGDHILEVNSIRFENIASSSAVKVLTGTTRLRMTVKRVGKIPGFKFAREKTSWFDTNEGQMVEGSLEDHGTFHYPTGLAFVDGVIERRVHLSIQKDGQYLGFNIRGGSEYGLGVYVSKVDPGGMAEQKGLKVGDQITAVNGESLENLTHGAAVDILRNHKTLVLTVRDVGKFPAFKEIYAEYSWIDSSTGSVTRSRSGLITSVPVTSSQMDHGDGSHYPFSSRHSRDEDLDNITDSHNRTNGFSASIHDNSDGDSEEEQLQEMTFPDDACLRIQLPSESPTTSDDRESEVDPDTVIQQFDTMLLPHSSDVILQERPVEESSVDEVKGKGKGKKRDKENPRSRLGVQALQLENMPEEMRKLDKSHRDRIQSLRKPGEINPRQFEDIELNVKKTRTFREMLFGTKSRAKLKGQGPVKTRGKTRQPLTNLGFADTKTDKAGSAASLELNLEGSPKAATFVRGLGSQMMLHDSVNQMSSTHRVGERARELLTEDEVLAVTRHLTRYEAQGDVEALVTPLLAILDTSEKMALLSDVRGIIKGTDLARFDAVVAKSEADAYKLATETNTASLNEQREQNPAPPRKTLMASVPDSQGTFKLKKHEEYKLQQQKQAQVEREHRERLARLAQEKRQSLTEVEPHLPTTNNINGSSEATSPRSRNILDVLKPKGNSKVYKAVKTGMVSPRSNNNSHQNQGGNANGGLLVKVREQGEVNSIQQVDASDKHVPEEPHTNNNGSIYTSSTQSSSRRSSASSSGKHGMYSLTDRRSDSDHRISASHPDLYSVSTIDADLNDSICSSRSQQSVTQISQYRTAEQSQSESVVMLISKTQLNETNHRDNDSLQAALQLIDGLDDEGEVEGGGCESPQISPRSVTSISTTTSTRFGSYDIHQEPEPELSDEAGSPRNPPVFIPPPPPLEPPPGTHNDEDEGWSEWVTEDVTEEVMASSSVGVSVGEAVMRDKAVGQTPQDSPQDSVRDSMSSIGSKNENLSNSNSNINHLPATTMDYFGGSQNETNIWALETDNISSSDKDSLHRGAVKSLAQVTNGNQEPPAQVNSLRDTLRARRKSADRPRLSAEAFVFPEHLLVPDWGRIPSQADSQQEEVVIDHQTVEYCDPPRGPPRSPIQEPTESPLREPCHSPVHASPISPPQDTHYSPTQETYSSLIYESLSSPPDESPNSPTHEIFRSATDSITEPIYSIPDLSHKANNRLQNSPEKSNHINNSHYVESNNDTSSTANSRLYQDLLVQPEQRTNDISELVTSYEVMPRESETRRVSVAEVETFMSQSETRGDEYLRQQRALESVIYARPQEERTEVSVEEPALIILYKTSAPLGMSISGGKNSRTQPQVKIEKVFPAGAAAEVGLKAGMRLISIDGRSLANVTHRQAVDLIRRSYANKKHPEMELLVLA